MWFLLYTNFALHKFALHKNVLAQPLHNYCGGTLAYVATAFDARYAVYAVGIYAVGNHIGSTRSTGMLGAEGTDRQHLKTLPKDTMQTLLPRHTTR
jgi:hypothetical protein